MVANSNPTQSVVASGNRLFPLVSGSRNRAREYWSRQTPSLVVGTERCFDWRLRFDAQLFTSIAIYVFASAAISSTDGNLVSGCRFVESSMGLCDRLCFILRLVIGSRFSPLCLTCVLSNSPLGTSLSGSDLVTVRKLFPRPNAVSNCTCCSSSLLQGCASQPFIVISLSH